MNNLETCKKCTNRKFDRNQGLVCGLTDSKPDFVDACPDFSGDEKVRTKYKLEQAIRPNEQRAKTAVLMISIVLVLEIVSLISDYFQLGLLQRAQTGFISNAEASANDTRQAIIAYIYIAFYIISAITFIQWFRRAYYNLNQRITNCVHEEGWAAGSWFVPIVCLYRPYQIMKELWTETLTLIKKFTADYSPTQSEAVIGLWWTLWIVTVFIGNFVSRYGFRAETIDELITFSIVSMILSAISIPLAFVTIRMVKSYAVLETVLMEKETLEKKGV